MEEEKFQDDFRTYKERNWVQYIQRPIFHVYVMLAVSLFLSTLFVIVAISKVFPCGPNTREWEYSNGKCYYFSLEKTTWMIAKILCEDRRSQLAIIESMAEQNFLQTRTRNERHWIGLTDRENEGHWIWLGGRDSTTGFTYWLQGEPNNNDQGEDCAHLWHDGRWNDVYCTYSCYYVCEKPAPGTRPAHQGRT